MTRSVGRSWVVALVGIGVAMSGAQAQSGGNGFLFHRPVGSFTIRGGFDQASAGSSLFDYVIDSLTLGRGDFRGFSVGTDLSFRLSPRFDLVLGADYAASSAGSEFRHWEDQDNKPIEQTTTFRRLPLTAGLKAYLGSRGQSVGHFAWIPSKYVPFVGAGAGLMWYRFRQQGDFVDFQTFDVFNDEFESAGWTGTAYGTAGFDISLGPRFAVTTQGKYTYAKARVSGDFEDYNQFGKMDLSGFGATVGFYVRF
jgi:hypothetical protein